jgi:hypothetical protein
MEENKVMMEKIEFIKIKLPELFASLESSQTGRWGKMNAQQMVEHMSDFIRLARGQYKVEPIHPPEITAKTYAFMMSDKPFRENTPNPTLSDTPQPVKKASMKEAVEELRSEINSFFATYDASPGLKNLNPIFGNLDFSEQVQLLHKHGMHHARQFGLVE